MSSAAITIEPWGPEDDGPLIGVTECAEILGVERTRIARWRRTGLFPEPFGYMKASRVWKRDDVLEFKAQREADGGLRALRREMKAEAEA